MGLNVRHHHLRGRKFPHGNICRECKIYDRTLAFALMYRGLAHCSILMLLRIYSIQIDRPFPQSEPSLHHCINY